MPQTYAEYLETMRSYNFSPLPYETWADWQRHYHGDKARLERAPTVPKEASP